MSKGMKMSKAEVMKAYNEYISMGGFENCFTWHEYICLEEREYQDYQDYHMYGEAKFDEMNGRF